MPKVTSSTTAKNSSKPSKSKATAPVASSSKASKPASAKAKAAQPTADFDIDDIFAAPSTSALPAPPPLVASTSSKKKKKKAKKASAGGDEATDKAEVEVSRVQTVVDPSIGVGKKIEGPTGGAAELSEEMEAFKNSRGGGTSTGRRTEEGFSIYKEDQLGINDDEGGDTDLCPFDCQCCY